MHVLEWIYLLSVTALLVPVLIYPAALFIAQYTRPLRIPGRATPTVSLIISAYNEELIIRDKILNAMNQEYGNLVEIAVLSDSSTDRTDEIVRATEDPRVVLVRSPQRRGKTAAINAFCPNAKGEILLFTDANSMFAPGAISQLVRHFDDPSVGYTVGQQLYETADTYSGKSETHYWNLELAIKKMESRLSSVVGADGAIFAARKSHYESLSDDDISDFTLPLKIILKGKRGLFESEASCYEKTTRSFAAEYNRKYRIVNRSLRTVMKMPEVMNPWKVGIFSLQLLCHKVLRWFSPLFMFSLFISAAAMLFVDPVRGWILLAPQALFYFAGSLYLIPFFRQFPVVVLCFYSTVMAFAALTGITLALRGKTITTWQPQR